VTDRGRIRHVDAVVVRYGWMGEKLFETLDFQYVYLTTY
jgi:hypothetical protein